MPGYPIQNNFTYHAPSGNQPERYTQLREKAKELAVLIDQLTPVSREQSLAFTNLEQAVFWANASIARNENALPPMPVVEYSVEEMRQAREYLKPINADPTLAELNAECARARVGGPR